jgi:SAM-dependent methyltransferase
VIMVPLQPPSDPYKGIARFFPLFGRLMEGFLGGIRKDLGGILEKHSLSRVLDLGCGAGDLSRILTNQGFRPVCIDLSPSMLRYARAAAVKPAPFPLVLADGGSLPFKPLFDAAVLRFVLHEMDPVLRGKVWDELEKTIRPGGLLILIDFTVPERPGIYARLGHAAIHFIEHRMDSIYPPHYANYSEFMKTGGASAWVARRGAAVAESRRYFGGNLGLIAVRMTGQAPARSLPDL